MTSRDTKIVAVSHVGGKDQGDSEWHTIRAVFHNFADLPHHRGERVDSSTMECHGHVWTVTLYPRGTPESKDDDQVAIFLGCVSPVKGMVEVKANYRIRIPSSGKSFRSRQKRVFGPRKSLGWKDFANRSEVLGDQSGFLVDGNLTVEVDIQVAQDRLPTWTPSIDVASDWMKLLDSATSETADVLFLAGGEGKEREIHAHSLVLRARAPDLAALADEYDQGTQIPIEDVDPDIFSTFYIVRFVYGGQIPEKECLRDNARALISASNRLGITGLKLVAEAELASDGINVENAAELILFADGTHCAMLKEAAMDFFVENSEAVMESAGYAMVKESPDLLNELLTAALVGSKKRAAQSEPGDRDYKRMRVSTLRQKLDDKGLDVDGSKEMLISRLEEADTDSEDDD
eukprot:CAMPEP_0178474786 /NCGR_PEP_ID=MMETSP0696-20121128/2779_1 /TAXON_ID=265572 /ORGANISM="Extubocellulus spinifer, Strain CCMP396" /LENGTH=403 /DNA_ID=CAMNT_0020102045 /DNA_START=30 /DNA_END=1242 /DNA_ORIENTATION=-